MGAFVLLDQGRVHPARTTSSKAALALHALDRHGIPQLTVNVEGESLQLLAFGQRQHEGGFDGTVARIAQLDPDVALGKRAIDRHCTFR